MAWEAPTWKVPTERGLFIFGLILTQTSFDDFTPPEDRFGGHWAVEMVPSDSAFLCEAEDLSVDL